MISNCDGWFVYYAQMDFLRAKGTVWNKILTTGESDGV